MTLDKVVTVTMVRNKYLYSRSRQINQRGCAPFGVKEAQPKKHILDTERCCSQ